MTAPTPPPPPTAHSHPHPPILLYADRLRATLIGRGPHCHVNIAAQDPATAKKISRRHALIVWDSATSTFRLCVLGLNGVVVNGVARFADDDDDDEEDDQVAGQGIELNRGTVMEFPGGVRFEFMGERSPATSVTTTKTLVSSPMRGLGLAAAPTASDVEVEVQAHEQVEDALDAVQGLLSLASSSSSLTSSKKPQEPVAEPAVSSRSSMSPATGATASSSSSSFKPPRATASRPTHSSTANAPSSSIRRDPLLLQLDDPPATTADDAMDLDPPTATPFSADADADVEACDSEFDPDQTLPAIDILSARLAPAAESNENHPLAARSAALAALPQTPVRAKPAARKPTISAHASPNHTVTDEPDGLGSGSDSDDLSSSASNSPTASQSDPHGPAPMPLLDILVESFTFCARSDLSLAELLSEICANQVYYRTHPHPARWHATVLATLESNRMFALRPRNKWLKKATQWYYDPDRDEDPQRAARFREFGSAQPARRAKRRAETQYYVKDMTGKPVGGGSSRGAGGVRIVVPDENEEDDDEEGAYVKDKRTGGSNKKARTIRGVEDEMVMLSSDATVPGSPVMRRYAEVVEGRRARGGAAAAAASGKRESKGKGKVGGVRLDLED